MVGVTGYVLGDGSTIANSITGSDQILSARLMTAEGELSQIRQETQPNLLWALSGPGHFFDLAKELVIKVYPSSLLVSRDSTIWAGAFVFLLDRAKDLGAVMKHLMDECRYATSGLIMTTSPSPARKPSIIALARYTGDPADAEAAYKPLHDLKPLFANGSQAPIQNTSDGREAIGAKGDFKRFGIVGLRHFDMDSFLKTVEVLEALVAACLDAINTAFNSQWGSRPVNIRLLIPLCVSMTLDFTSMYNHLTTLSCKIISAQG